MHIQLEAATMAAKLFFVLSVAVCAASAIPLDAIYKYEHEDHEAPAHYEFEYSVHDTHTGDIKQQKESRAGDVVQGSYSLVQPDGVHRIVDYTSDKVNGFNANVRYEGHPIEPQHVAKVVAPAHYQYEHAPKIAYTAPKIAYVAPKIAYTAPKVAYVAPKLAYTTAPVAKIAYQAPLNQVTFSSPAISYHH